MSRIKNIKRQCSSIIAKYGKLYGFFILLLSPISLLLQYFIASYYVKKGRVNKYILFESYPDMSDNAIILLDYLLQNNILADYKIIWFVTKATQKVIQYKEHDIYLCQRFTKSGLISIDAIRNILTSQYIFSTHGVTFPTKKRINSQTYILLWHGCGYKGSQHFNVNWMFDKALIPGELFIEAKTKFWNTTPDHLFIKGYPRYDWLLHPSDKTKNVYEKIKGTKKKCILWMPTFRKNTIGVDFKESIISSFPLMNNPSKWVELDQECKKLDILLIIKCHMIQMDYKLDFSNMTNIIQIKECFFVEHEIPKYEFIALSDGLISDYSSVAIDYLIVDKPIAYALDDYEIYKDTRGFIFDNPLEFMPGHHLFTFEDLKKYLYDVSNNIDQYIDLRHSLRKKAIYESNCYCREIVEYLGLK